MRTWKLPLLVATAALCVPATASATLDHVVASGESLSSVAAADGLSVDQLAAANGISPDAQLTAGSTLAIPAQSGNGSSSGSAPATSVSSTSSGSGSGGGYVVAPGDTLSAIAARYGVSVDTLASANGLDPSGVLPAGATLSVGGSSSGSAPATASAPSTSSGSGSGSGGGYVVAPGDTLSAIAARYGVSVDTLASANGLDPSGVLPAGATLNVGASPSSSAPTATASGSSSSASAGAQSTAESVSPSSVGSIAAQNGVSPSLAQAIADQESGFNNSVVSSSGATGVMQIEPGTWKYIQRNLGGPALAPGSASDNVRGGVELLHSLLNQTGGDPALAAAGYYQGLASVRAHGVYSDTQKYVNNVMALRQRFGGQ